jgi:nitrogen fixation NifU-like protein
MNEHELEDLYREVILDHYRYPRNRGELPSPPALSAQGFNPLCGDEVTVFIELAGKTINEIKFKARGCSISQSSASLMTQAVKGKTIQETEEIIKTFKQMMLIHESTISQEADQQVSNTDNAEEKEDKPVDLTKLGEVAALQGVVRFPVRIKCAVLPWNTLIEVLQEVN